MSRRTLLFGGRDDDDDIDLIHPLPLLLLSLTAVHNTLIPYQAMNAPRRANVKRRWRASSVPGPFGSKSLPL